MVVVPTLLTTRAEIEEQIERLEIHSLASPDDDLRFALLSDWTDSATESAPGDEDLLAAAAEAIAAVESTPRAGAGWRPVPPAPSPTGLERGRGKVDRLGTQAREAARAESPASRRDRHDVPGSRRPPARRARRRSLRDHARRRYATPSRSRETPGRKDGPPAQPSDARWPHSGRVVEGYAVLQPRVTPSLPTGREGSLFQRVFSGRGGMDPYAFAVSDVYQDLFGEGSYTGKGIYDVDVFEAALEGRVPDNTLLSHDLFEGIFARAGLVSDIEVVEEFPSRYDVAAARQHRWARGDWQLLPWILGRGPDSSGAPARAAIPMIGRWKMLDNLRRTLSRRPHGWRSLSGLDAASRCRRPVERVRSRNDRDPHSHSLCLPGSCRDASGSRSGATYAPSARISCSRSRRSGSGSRSSRIRPGS